MEIKSEHCEYFKEYSPNDEFNISDEQTTLYLKAKTALTLVKVDNGIIDDTTQKCDYLSNSDVCTNFIELKGARIEKAYKQIESTIRFLSEDDYYNALCRNNKVFAIIVSPGRRSVIPGLDKKERNLAKEIAKLNLNKEKSKNILDYILYVTVIPNLKRIIREKNNIIKCSNRARLEIE